MGMPFMKRSGVGVVEISGVIGGSLRVPTYARLLDGLRAKGGGSGPCSSI